VSDTYLEYEYSHNLTIPWIHTKDVTLPLFLVALLSWYTRQLINVMCLTF